MGLNDDQGQTFAIHDDSAIGEARRHARAYATRLGLDADDAERAALVLTEAATNILKHAGKGDIVLQPVLHEATPALALLALDRGPGIPDIDRAMQDGYSTGGTAGTGLGAIKRQTEWMDVYAPRGKGTAVLAMIRARHGHPVAATGTAPLPVTLGAVRLPYPGENVCGDVWAITRTIKGFAVFVADGLGHGPSAADASIGAARSFLAAPDADPGAALEAASAATRSTRGSAASIASVDVENKSLRFAGLGNVAGVLITGFGHQGLLGHNGIVGQDTRRVSSNAYSWPTESALVMYSDGLGSRWRSEEYPGLLRSHPLLIAGVLLRDHRRQRDDVTIVVTRWGIPR